MVPAHLSRVLLPAVQGQTRRKPGTQSFRSVSTDSGVSGDGQLVAVFVNSGQCCSRSGV